MTSNFLPPVQGEVIERINRKEFLVRCKDNDEIITGYVVARFRTKEGRRKANIAVGDDVIVEIFLRDQKKGAIITLVEKSV